MNTMKTKLLMISLFIPLLIFAQTGIQNLFTSGTEIWVSFSLSLVALIAAITEVTELIKSFTGANGTISKIISWSLGIVLAVIGNLMNLGIFENADWIWTLILGAAATLAANGLFTYDFVKMILNFLTPKFHKVTNKNE